MYELYNKNILVTGASSGIGYQVAIYLSKLGSNVIITGRNEERLNQCYNELSGKNNFMFIADLTDETDINNLFYNIKMKGIKLNGLVHCAGIPGVLPIKGMSKNFLKKIFDVNFFSFISLVKEFMKKNNSEEYSKIVVLSSMAVHKPRPFELGYIASKSAVEAAIPIIAMEYKQRHLNINAIIVGLVNAGMAKSAFENYGSKQEWDEIAKSSLIGWETPQNIAEIIAFFMHDNSRIINGRCIYADGGIF